MIERCAGESSTLQILASRLREAREARGLSVAGFAEQIFLRPAALEALESGDPSRLPAGLHLIEQVRWVASNLDLDVEPLLERLREEPRAAPQPEPDTAEPVTAPVVRSAAAKRRSGPLLAALGMSLALGGGAVLLARAPQRPAAPVAAPARKAPVLVLSSTEPSWLEIRTPDGVVIFEGLLEGRAAFALGTGLEVLAGRPDLVVAAVGSARGEPLGPIERLEWYRFGSDGRRLPEDRSTGRP